MSTRIRGALPLLFAPLLLLAGCGDDEASTPGASGQASAVSPTRGAASGSSGDPDVCAEVLSDQAFTAMGWKAGAPATAPTAGQCERTATEGSLRVHVVATPNGAADEFEAKCEGLSGDAGDVGADLGFVDTDAELCGRLPDKETGVGAVEIYAHTDDDRLIVVLGAVLEATPRADLEKGLDQVIVAAVDDPGLYVV